jgi:hypothetical protein
MKLVASFEKPEQAHLLRAHLEGSGIAAFVRDEHTVSVDWRLSGAIGGVKVEVPDEDFAAARELIVTSLPARQRDPEKERRSQRKFRRYFRVFVVLLVAITVFVVWRKGVSAENLGFGLFCGLILSSCIAVFCSLFER